jgi:GT2 family glycosyltransferase
LLGAIADLPFAYDLWIAGVERHSSLKPQFRADMREWTWQPQFTVLLYAPGGSSPEQLEKSRGSVEQQIYPSASIIEAPDDCPAAALRASDADYIIPLRAGDALSETALFRFAEVLQASRPGILYGDEDQIDGDGRRRTPWFKPQWNEEMFLAQDYLSRAVAIERELASRALNQLGGTSTNLSSLLLAATAAAGGAIVHVPHILCHVDPTAPEPDWRERITTVEQLVRPTGAKCSPGPFRTVKVEWPLPADLPLVSIIVPTKDKLELLRPCIDSVLDRTSYPNFEVLVVDNGSVERRTLEYLAEAAKDSRVRVLSYPEPYNFSSINNFAAQQARGAFLCLLNNDTEVIERDWLTEMMRYAVRPEIGAVGAKLLYEDGSIQHAGVVVGIGDAAGHAHRFLPADRPGYFRQPHVAQFVTAVTAACLVVDKRKFGAVHGFDEEGLAIAFNDVDLCLKLQAAGWRNVYVPHAVLLHHESKSRGSDMAPKHVGRYRRELSLLQERWDTKTYEDPLHNPNLDRYSETFVLRL